MESIIKVHNLSKNEFISIIQDLFDERFDSLQKSKEGEILTVKQTSNLLGVTELTIYNYIKKGLVPASKIGRRIVIRKIDIDNALSEVKSLKYKRDV